ncbi:unnamed protein product [Durusdinium trenchii]|uniref:Uncharacterized protein n=1 Tax=Durusdinium trenchii TaxID=1381693 RepID=A0ABP0LGZ4_9DINO
MARIWREGQTKPCYIYRFVLGGTLEEKICQRQQVKTDLAHITVDGQDMDADASRLSWDELRRVFALEGYDDQGLPSPALMTSAFGPSSEPQDHAGALLDAAGLGKALLGLHLISRIDGGTEEPAKEMPPAPAERGEQRQAAALKPSNVMFQAPPIPKQAPSVSAQSWQQGWGGTAMQPPPNVQLNNAVGRTSLPSASPQQSPHGGLPTKEMPPALAEPAERRQAAALKPSNVMFQAPPIPKQAPGVSAQSWQQGWGGMAMQPPPNVQLNNAMGLQSACSQEGPHGGLPTKAEDEVPLQGQEVVFPRRTVLGPTPMLQESLSPEASATASPQLQDGAPNTDDHGGIREAVAQQSPAAKALSGFGLDKQKGTLPVATPARARCATQGLQVAENEGDEAGATSGDMKSTQAKRKRSAKPTKAGDGGSSDVKMQKAAGSRPFLWCQYS